MTNSYKGYKVPNPEQIEEPDDINTEKIPLGPSGYTKTSNGRKIHNIVAAIHNRMAEGLAPFVLITGESQMGKTWTALRIAYELHEITNAASGNFTEKNILYKEEQALNSMTCNFDKENSKPAIKQVLLGDELGEQANANTHNSTENMAWKMILNVMPLLGNCIIGIDPKSDRIDKKLRDAPNYRLWMIDIGVCKGIGRRYLKTDKKGKDVWSTDYFSAWNVEKPPDSYLDKWKPKEVRYKLTQPIDYLKKLEDKDKTQSIGFNDF